MLILIGAGLVLALVFLPGLWVQRVLSKYAKPVDRYPGTGGELARHLLDELGLADVRVEVTEQGDHYDPTTRAVRLTQEKFVGRSLTAITVAAHEVGHAHQDSQGFKPLRWRSTLVKLAAPAQRVGAGILMLAPLIGIVSRTPLVGLLMFLGGFLAMGMTTVIHLVTLPTELDASFARALPWLREGGYLKDGDEPHARKLLRAAALTYLSASLMSLLNVARWWTILRR
jgi:Zn-dependent membrane protease YugP